MENVGKTLVLRGISLPYRAPAEEAVEAARRRLKKAGLSAGTLSIHKRSVDARKKDDIRFVYSIQGQVCGRITPKVLAALDAVELIRHDAPPPRGTEAANGRIVVVGFGPCGMFAALRLARAGYRPLVLERGDDIVRRRIAVNRFHTTGILDEDSNVQFGAGGAGSFSDGKLMTRVNDPLSAYVLQTYHDFGAPDSILTLAKPHVGTDNLFEITRKIDAEIRRLGGDICYRVRMTGLRFDASGRVNTVVTNKGDVSCGALIAAVGHSARDTYRMLLGESFDLTGKDFSVGARIEHLQEDIDRAMYGDADVSILGHAEYSLSLRSGERGVYSFCMCPGGEVVCASSEEGRLVVNGMSYYARNGRNADSAIAVSVLKSDYGGDPLKAIDFQERIERAAFSAAGGDFCAPVQTLSDFYENRAAHAPNRVLPTYREACFVSVRDLNGILPDFVCEMMKCGISDFARKIDGFAAPDAVLTGVETRTSAPIRILRGDDLTAPRHSNVYPCGEGAGYAGGITSAAIDGLRAADAVIRRYRPETT